MTTNWVKSYGSYPGQRCRCQKMTKGKVHWYQCHECRWPLQALMNPAKWVPYAVVCKLVDPCDRKVVELTFAYAISVYHYQRLSPWSTSVVTCTRYTILGVKMTNYLWYIGNSYRLPTPLQLLKTRYSKILFKLC